MHTFVQIFAGCKVHSRSNNNKHQHKKNWFYTACNECMSKVKEDGGIYRCINHGRQAQPCYRYVVFLQSVYD